MKATFPKSACNASMLFVICLFTTNTVFAQPQFKFSNSSLIRGTDKQVNAEYRFPNVKAGIDAIVKIEAINGDISLHNIDRTADGYGEAFQPEYKISGLAVGAYIDFLITFVQTGTRTAVLLPRVEASGLDIDGDHQGVNLLTELNRVDMGGGFYMFNTNNTQLSVSKIGTAFQAKNITGILFGALVDTAAKEVMYTVINVNVTSMKYRVGATNLLPSTGHRYASLYFASFYYPGIPLGVSKILDFQGSNSGKRVGLSWKMDTEGEWNQCTLERCSLGGKYEPVAVFLPGERATNDYSYVDNLTADGYYCYRLKLMGTKGEITYSTILAFRTTEQATTPQDLNVYPTVITNQFTVKLNNIEGKQPAIIQLVDYTGRTIYSKAVQLQQGVNNIGVNDFNTTAKGQFVIVMKTATRQLTKAVLIQ